MESPNAPPAHDFFTPAWLKLPDPQVSKKASTVSPSTTQSSVDPQHKRFLNSYSSSQRKDSNNSTSSLSNGTIESRDRFATNFHDSSQPYLRHHSFGSETQFSKPNAQPIGSNVNGFRNKKYIDSSQRPTFRSNYREKGSIGNHSNTKTNRNADTFKPTFNSPLKKSFNNSSDFLDNELTQKSANTEQNCNVFNQEFPSLVNDINGQKGSPNDNSSFHNAWSNSATKSKVLSTSKKFQLIHSSVSNFDNIESNKLDTNNTSKPLLTSPTYRAISLIGKSKTGILKENAVYSRIQPMITKTSAQTTTPAMEILVKNPKKRLTNKIDFLNSIRNNDKEFDKELNRIEKLDISSDNRNNGSNGSELKTNLDDNKQMSCVYESDVKKDENINYKYISRQSDDFKGDEDMGVLSSSLEAEHRLLLELGWKAEQDDDPSYAPLTEDEVKEFKDLINARNGLNGLKRYTTTQSTSLSNQTIHLSPKKWSTNEELDDESSSSSDDD